jgi:hypothetical protein
VQLLSPPRPVPVRTGSYRRGPSAARHLVRWLEGQPVGNRNSGLYWAAKHAIRDGDEETAVQLAGVVLAAGLGETEVYRTIESARRTVGDVG